MAGSKTVANQEPRLGNLRVQTSLYGLTLPVVYGRTRITGNLIWYGGFKSIRQEDRAEAGKGGSPPSRTYYTYTASVIMALADSPITAVRAIWKGKEKFFGSVDGPAFQLRQKKVVVPASTASAVVLDLALGETFQYIQRVFSFVAPAVTYGDDPRPEQTEDLLSPADYSGATTITFVAMPQARRITIQYVVQTALSQPTALAQLGLGAKRGLPGQTPWSYLTAEFPEQALGYSGVSYIYGRDYSLSNYAEVENHTFEVDGPLQFSATNPDCNPADVIEDILLNPLTGCQFPAQAFEEPTQYSNLCVASGLFISPAYVQQRPARDAIQEILDATNSDGAWTGSKLRIVPRLELEVTGNGVTYVPNRTPVVNLTVDDYLDVDGAPDPIQIERVAEGDLPTTFRANYVNRGDYNTEVVSTEDEAAVRSFGNKPNDVKSWEFFTEGRIAQSALEMVKHRRRSVRNRHSFSLPWRFDRLELGDLVTHTYPKMGLDATPALIVELSEGDDDQIDVVTEDFPVGHTDVPLMEPQLGSGFRPDYNAAPGAIDGVVLFEPPGGFTNTGLEVWLAVSSANAMWGGCDVYASLDDGESFRLVSTIQQRARVGRLTSRLARSVGATFAVQMLGASRLFSVTEFDADARQTLCLIGGVNPEDFEFIGYETATMTDPGKYSITDLRRAWYGTQDIEHPAGAPFVFIDNALGTSGPLDRSLVGKSIRFKLVSFNVFGGGRLSLENAPEYLYTVTGRFIDQGERRFYAPNKLPNPSFAAGVSQWKRRETTGRFRLRKNDDPATALPSSVSGALLLEQILPWFDGGDGSTRDAAIPDAVVDVEAGRTYVAAAKLLPQLSPGRLRMTFYDASNQRILPEVLSADVPDRSSLYNNVLVPAGQYRLDSAEVRRLWGPAIFRVDRHEAVPLRTLASGRVAAASIRFRATSDSNFTTIGLLFDTSVTGCAGSYPFIRVHVFQDDGTPAHLPNFSAAARASAVDSLPIVDGVHADGDLAYHEFTLNNHATPAVVAGSLYHIVITNEVAAADDNWVSLHTGAMTESSMAPSEFIGRSEFAMQTIDATSLLSLGTLATNLQAPLMTDRSASGVGQRRLLPMFGALFADGVRTGVLQRESGNFPADRLYTVTEAMPVRNRITTTVARSLDGLSLWTAAVVGGSMRVSLMQGTTEMAYTFLDQPVANFRLGNDGEGILTRYDLKFPISQAIALSTTYDLVFTPIDDAEFRFGVIQTGADDMYGAFNFGGGRAEHWDGLAWITASPTDKAYVGYDTMDFGWTFLFHLSKSQADLNDPRLVSSYDPIAVKAVAPSGAVRVDVQAEVESATGIGDPYVDMSKLYVFEPYFAEVPESFEGFPPWNAGGQNSIGSDQMERHAATQVLQSSTNITHPDGVFGTSITFTLERTADVLVQFVANSGLAWIHDPGNNFAISPSNLLMEAAGRMWLEQYAAPSTVTAYEKRFGTASAKMTGTTRNEERITTVSDAKQFTSLPAGTYTFRLRSDQTWTNGSAGAVTQGLNKYFINFGVANAVVTVTISYR